MRYNKQRQIDDIKMTLKNQIDEKKKQLGEKRIYDNVYNDLIKSNVEKYALEKEYKIKRSQERTLNYKDLLDKQVIEKEKRRCFMDEKEKQYNKELIGKIYNEFNIDENNFNTE